MSKKRPLTIIYLVDGARPDVIHKLLESDKLPNIYREIVKPGTFRKATSCMPSTTGPAYLPFLTGCFPGTLNIPGIRWLDKAEYHAKRLGKNRFRSYNGIESPLFNDDLPPDHPTLFEIFDRSFNIFSLVTRGVPKTNNLTRFSRPFWYLYAHLTDRWYPVDHTAHHYLMQCLDQDPDFVFVVFPAVDSYSHLNHPHHQNTLRAYRFIDFSVGEVTKKLKQQGRWDNTLFILTSDHGLTATHSHLDLALFLQNRGLKTLYYPLIWKTNCHASVMISGNALGQIYLLDKNQCPSLSEEQIKRILAPIFKKLLTREEVDFIICRGAENTYVIESAKGRASIIRKPEGLCYIPERNDPLGFGYLASPMNRQQALNVTFDSDYPDALVQIDQLFSSVRCGDLIVISKNGYDLRKSYEWPEHHGSHGSLCREHMLVPLIYNQTGWDSRPARTTDVFNTILKWSEKPVLDGTDGKPLC